MSTLLEPLQNAVVAHLGTLEALSTIPVLGFKSGDLDNLIERTVERAQGACVLVLPPLPLSVANAPHMVFERVGVTIRLAIYPYAAESLPSLCSLGETLSAALHQWSPELDGWHSPLRLSEKNPWESQLAKRASNAHTLDLNFYLSGTLLPT